LATYLELVNKIARRTGWDETTAPSFADPGRPWDVFKDFLNEAKDEIFDELAIRAIEQEFLFRTQAPEEAGTIGMTVNNPIVTGTGTTFLSTHVGNKMLSGGFEGWHRISSFVGATLISLDSRPRATFTGATYSIFEDEYDLDPTARRIISAWIDRPRQDLEFVSEPYWNDRYHEPSTSLGVPREIMLFRSDTTAQIWQAQLRPIPDDIYTIRYKAETRLADLSSATGADFWEIAPEIETFIVDRAVFKALSSSIGDQPDLAITTRADLRDRVDKYRERHSDPTPHRRLRRMGPDELPGPSRPRLDPSRFH